MIFLLEDFREASSTRNTMQDAHTSHLCSFKFSSTYDNKGKKEQVKLVLIFSSVQFSRSVMSNSLRPHGLQHARPPCPSPTPGVYSNSCPLSIILCLKQHIQSFVILICNTLNLSHVGQHSFREISCRQGRLYISDLLLCPKYLALEVNKYLINKPIF